jgi:hypothetical protein
MSDSDDDASKSDGSNLSEKIYKSSTDSNDGEMSEKSHSGEESKTPLKV